MSIYIHIPFCKQACHYCDFHFSTNLQLKSEMVNAICQEIILQKDYLSFQTLESVYLGGGTPSLLNEVDLVQIFQSIQKYFNFSDNIEITLEANPDDLTKDKIQIFKAVGINRLSIGIQSFYEPHLQYLNRSHTAENAANVVKTAQNLGIENITIDLIYAIPAPNHQIWEQDLQKAIDLDVKHISAYCLTIEEKTVFGKWLKTQKIPAIDEIFAAKQFEILMDFLKENTFEQYEISNFAKEKKYSKHNSNYWKKGSYLGIGPSAHSYNGHSRQFNIANNAKYIQAIQKNQIPFEIEHLSTKDQINEYLLTSLRTQWGFDIAKIKENFEIDFFSSNKNLLEQYFAQDLLIKENNILLLTQKGKFFADEITANLFLI